MKEQKKTTTKKADKEVQKAGRAEAKRKVREARVAAKRTFRETVKKVLQAFRERNRIEEFLKDDILPKDALALAIKSKEAAGRELVQDVVMRKTQSYSCMNKSETTVRSIAVFVASGRIESDLWSMGKDGSAIVCRGLQTFISFVGDGDQLQREPVRVSRKEKEALYWLTELALSENRESIG